MSVKGCPSTSLLTPGSLSETDRPSLFSPTPPFTLIVPRLRIAMILGSVCVVSLFLSGHMIVKSVALTIGLVFFGDPVLSRAVGFLDKNIPNWKEYMDIEKYVVHHQIPEHG